MPSEGMFAHGVGVSSGGSYTRPGMSSSSGGTSRLPPNVQGAPSAKSPATSSPGAGMNATYCCMHSQAHKLEMLLGE